MGIFFDDVFYESLFDSVSIGTNVALSVVYGMILLNCIWLFLKGTDLDTYLDLGKKYIFQLILLFNYNFIIITVGQLIIVIAQAFYEPSDGSLFAILKEPFERLPDMEFSWWSLAFGEKQDAYVQMVLLGILSFLVGLVSVLFEFVQIIYQSFLYVFGPIMIGISFLDGYKDSIKRWATAVVAVNFWSVAYAILMALFLNWTTNLMTRTIDEANAETKAVESLFSFSSEGVTDNIGYFMDVDHMLQLIVISLVIIIGLFSIPLLMSKLMPDSGMGSLATMAMGAITYGAVKLASSLAGAAAGTAAATAGGAEGGDMLGGMFNQNNETDDSGGGGLSIFQGGGLSNNHSSGRSQHSSGLSTIINSMKNGFENVEEAEWEYYEPEFLSSGPQLPPHNTPQLN